jgi:hypothetical protein
MMENSPGSMPGTGADAVDGLRDVRGAHPCFALPARTSTIRRCDSSMRASISTRSRDREPHVSWDVLVERDEDEE